MKAVGISIVLACGNIVGHIHVPPGVVIIDAVPGVLGGGFVRGAVHNVARNVVATAEGGEEIGKIIADTFMGT